MEPLTALNQPSAHPQTSPVLTGCSPHAWPVGTSALSLAQRTELGRGRGAWSEPDITLPNKPPTVCAMRLC